MELDNRFSIEFNHMLFDKYGDPECDFSMRIVAESNYTYYLEIRSESGLSQLVYYKGTNIWEFIN